MYFSTQEARWRAVQLHNAVTYTDGHYLNITNCETVSCAAERMQVSWVLRNLTASCKNIHAVAMVSTCAMTSHCTSVCSCHLTDAKALRNTYVGKDLPAHVMKGNGSEEAQLLLFVTSVPNVMYSVWSYDLRTNNTTLQSCCLSC